MISDRKIRAYALRNAIHYKGKANSGAVISALFHEGLKKEDVKKNIKKINSVVKEVNFLSLEEQKNEFEKLEKEVSEREVREGLQELPNTKKGVVMRFAPSASGPLHIGHALVFCLNLLYVQKYGGTFYVRIEDTNPNNIYKPAYKMLKEESKWLSKGKAKVVIQSDRMELYYKYAEKLIKKGFAYICTCSADKFRKFVKNKKNCPCRKLSVKQNIDRWNKMLYKKGYKVGEAVLRFKSDMKHKNPAMRDFPLARINETSHPRQRKKYRVWPLMNLAVSVDDIEMKMTHVIRGKDHRDNAERQKMIYKVLNKKFPWNAFLGKIHFKDLELSSTKMREGIESGKYSGWDDKRLPTIASLRKQGYKPEAFWKFAEQVGLSESDKVMDKEEYFKLLKSFNR
jgi:glutamyl-tRNA synthetase